MEDSRLSRRLFLVGGLGIAGGAVLSHTWHLSAVDAKDKVPHEISLVQFSDQGQIEGNVKVQTIVKSDEEWKQQLTREAYEVARKEGTERPYTGEYWNLHENGLYRCICCNTALFRSDTKFESGTGWPSFWQPIAKENVRETSDMTLGMMRTAVACKRCDAHLGHVFDDGPKPTGLRYCMNSVSLKFVKFA